VVYRTRLTRSPGSYLRLSASSRPPARDTLEPIHLGSLQIHTLPLYLVYYEHVAYAFRITVEKACIVPVLVFLDNVISALVYLVLNYFGSLFTSVSFIFQPI
jgi:hypothetical protein